MMAEDRIDTPGRLHFCLALLLEEYLMTDGPPSYNDYNAAIGVLECAKQEIYRRFIGPYEDKKIEENGDAYPRLRKLND